jgi:hypothetical protein
MSLDLTPPIEVTFPIYQDLLTSLNEYAKDHGYAVSVLCSKTNSSKKPRLYILQRIKGGPTRDQLGKN